MTLFSSQPGDEGLPGPARARVMAAIMTTTLMGVFDGTMINIALPSMAQEMQVPASIAVWFANGYLLAAAMTLAIFAALAARLGYRPVFLAGLTTFTLTSLGCALANKPEVLIGMRVLQGIGGAATLSIAPAILRSVFPGRLLGRILGFHALLIASSSAIGPVLGGTILHTLSWQWLFAINILPGTLALLLAVRALPRDAIRMQAPFDTVGAILSALLLGSTIMAANSLQNATSQFGSLCWMALAALSGMAFIWQIRRTGHPLLPPSMFKNERFYPRGLHVDGCFCQPGDHLYCATLPVSERIRLQSGSVCPAVYAVAIRDRADCAACRPLGGHDISPGDIHPGAGDICRRFDPAGDVTRQTFNVGYLPAKSGMRNRVWLLSESQ
ncbi:FIG00731681: hypothetical protein [Klebsiella pneumoniae IS43]|uniref:Major facilitator superfamily (MFS) profile domain-containing protein n=1 Tax=Klebsiella pneumoniae IS43 TaxID=1432552 RepID=W1DP66_KLEPN|nr:FIG00731681: hypothetical protein [Klebsiella pneumoniae IS43]